MASDDDALAKAVKAQSFPIARSWAILACESALSVWDALRSEIDFEYCDSVVGLGHQIDPELLRRTLGAIAQKSATPDLTKEWLEPITALQDDDWSLAEPARMAFYACYNALLGESAKDASHFATSIKQARSALSAFYEDAHVRGIWSAWWARASSLEGVRHPPYGVEEPVPAPAKERAKTTIRLSESFSADRFEEFAVALFGHLRVALGTLRREERTLLQPEFEVESAKQTLWTDGTHTFEVRHVLEIQRSMESRDSWDEATIEIPELDVRLSLIGSEELGQYTIEAERERVGGVRLAAHWAAIGLFTKPRVQANDDFLHDARMERHELFASALRRGVAIDGQDDRGYTALAWAAHNGRSRAVRALLELGADPNIADDNGITPLMHAVGRSREGREEMAAALLAAGARVNRPDDMGRTALMRVGSPGGSPIVKLLLSKGADVAMADALGQTALHHYADGGRVEEAAVLFDKWQTKVDVRDDAGNTPLHIAAARSHASPDYTGDGSAPGGRIEVDHLAMVRLLVERGASLHARNTKGETPLERAVNAKNEGIAAFLRSRIAPK